MTDTAVSTRVQLRAAFCTDPGRVRANNEDVPLLDENRGVYGVIDGVGGHAAGEIAARLASDVIVQRLARPLGTPTERVREAIAIANNEIFRHADESPELHGMACVVTLAIVSDGVLTIGHVGDSRLYLLRGNGMQKLTHDHSPVGEREDAREISEIDAMRHPRRNEVFRDVGSAYRDKDDEEFVEVIEVPFAPECAILLCTDGLTDMVPSLTIDRIIRQHAGRPERVAQTLVAAANDAGGRDNVTVVYAEGPRFAAAAGPSRTPGDEILPPYGDAIQPAARRHPGRLALLVRAMLRSRTMWFAAGGIAGVMAALTLVWWIGATTFDSGRTLAVGATATGAFARISDAAAVARPGDVIRVEPGIYHERIDIPDGVDLIARVPGTVTVARPPGAVGEAVGMTARGESSARIVGIRVESTPELPLDIGVRISGPGRTVELLEVAGPMRTGIDVQPAAGLAMHGSHFEVTGPAMTFAEGAHGVVTSCVFLRRGVMSEAPIHVLPSADVALRRNVFAGFGPDIVKGFSGESLRQLRANNVIVAAESQSR
jgi:serine/threonine protein phosphatase PrpC